MSTYYIEDFESTSVGSLPANWSTYLNSGTAAVSSTIAHGGSNSLKIAPAATKHTYAWNTTPDTNNGVTILDFWFNLPSVSGTDCGIACWLRGQAGVTSDALPKSINMSLDVFGGGFSQCTTSCMNNIGSLTQLQKHNPTGFASLFSLNAWYRIVFQVRDVWGDSTTVFTGASTVGAGWVVSVGCQRASDGKWLVAGASSDSWVDTGVVTFFMVKQTVTTGNSAWGAGTAGFSIYGQAAGNNLYIDDVSFYDYTQIPNWKDVPAWVPGNSAQLQGTYTGVDTGGSGISNISDGDVTTNYQSTALYEAWAMLDLGVSNTATATRMWLVPNYNANPGSASYLPSYEYMVKSMVLEGANSSTGPFTQIGTSYQEAEVRGQLVYMPITAGSAYRYFRIINHDLPMYLAEWYLEGQLGAGSPSWRPVRPTLNPASGKFANGATVALSTPTSGASIYYTTDGSTPTTSSTLYTGPITLPSNAVTTVKAIAYHAPPGGAAAALIAAAS